MEPTLTDEEIRKIAKARVSFRVHALVYLAVNGFLVALWYVTIVLAGGRPALSNFWPVWTLLAWGMGLAIHGFTVYGGGVDWERREEARLRRRLPPGQPPRS